MFHQNQGLQFEHIPKWLIELCCEWLVLFIDFIFEDPSSPYNVWMRWFGYEDPDLIFLQLQEFLHSQDPLIVIECISDCSRLRGGSITNIRNHFCKVSTFLLLGGNALQTFPIIVQRGWFLATWVEGIKLCMEDSAKLFISARLF